MGKAYSDQKNWSDTYLTDPKLIELLGPFDTDPCCPENMPWKTASVMYTEKDDGLKQEWKGRVFMNPPYRGVLKWAQKFVQSGTGIALLNGRSTETRATQWIMQDATAIWFPLGRLTFYKIDGTPYEQKWFSSLLLGLGRMDREALEKAKDVFGGKVYYR
jgi:hypothetical protein